MSDTANSLTGLVETGLVGAVALKSLQVTGDILSNSKKQSVKSEPMKKETVIPKKKHHNAFDFSSYDNPFDFRF